MNKFFGPFIGGRAAVGLLLLRLTFGLGIAYHGWGKIQHPFSWMGPEATTPGIMQALAALGEFGGGLGIAAGLLTPLAALGVVATMAGAFILVHLPKHNGFDKIESALDYLIVGLTILLTGPGALSLDALIFGKKENPYAP